MAKWVLDAETRKPMRVDNQKAAEIVERGGKYLGLVEAKRMLAAQQLKEGATK